MAFDDDDCPLREPPKTLEEMRERAALAAEQCPSAHTLPDRMFGWARAQEAIATAIRAIPVASSGARAPQDCLDRRRDADCVSDMVVCCEHHHELRLQNAEKAAQAKGEADERLRIVTIIRNLAASDFLANREENARLYRDLITIVQHDTKKKG